MAISWRDELAVDAGVIDDDHKHLIEIVNQFTDLVAGSFQRQALLAVARELWEYTHVHFQREEELQRRVQYPFLVAHKHEHEDLMRRLEMILDELYDAGSIHRMQTIGRELAELLKRWLVDHIIHSDRRMRPYVEQMRQHAAQMNRLKKIARPPQTRPAPTRSGPAAAVRSR